MISELFFAREYNAFWHDLLPMEEKFVREINTFRVEKFAKSIRAVVAAKDRDFVNELAFRLFREDAANRKKGRIYIIPERRLKKIVAETKSYIESRRRPESTDSQVKVYLGHIGEAQLLASR